jgi:hypothetical protein
LTLKLACATFGVQNGVKIPFKRRDFSIRNEISEFLSKFESLRFAISRDCFDAEIGVLLRSACRIERKEPLNSEISQSGKK